MLSLFIILTPVYFSRQNYAGSSLEIFATCFKAKADNYPTSALFHPVGRGMDRGFANLVSEGWHHAKRHCHCWHCRSGTEQTVVCVCILHGLLTRLTMRPRHAALTRRLKSRPFTPCSFCFLLNGAPQDRFRGV